MALLCSCLAEAGAKIIALTVADTVEHGLVRCVVDHPDDACRVVEENGFNCLRAEVLAIEIPNPSASLASFTEHLAQEGINLQYLYGSHLPSDEQGLLILRVLDLDEAEESLGRWSL
jgi:hypothetical protein